MQENILRSLFVLHSLFTPCVVWIHLVWIHPIQQSNLNNLKILLTISRYNLLTVSQHYFNDTYNLVAHIRSYNKPVLLITSLQLHPRNLTCNLERMVLQIFFSKESLIKIFNETFLRLCAAWIRTCIHRKNSKKVWSIWNYSNYI